MAGLTLSTGMGTDFFYFVPFSSDFDIWEDAGGTDVLMLPDYSSTPFRAISYDGTALTVRISGGILTIPDSTLGTPSVEFVEYRQVAYGPGDDPESLGTLQLITDLGAVAGADIAVIGTKGDDVIAAPTLPQKITGFSEIFGNDGDDAILLSPTQDYRAFGGRGQDVIEGQGASDDFIAGGIGRDQLRGRDGNDEIFGGMHRDLIRGGAGNDVVYGDGSAMVTVRGFNDRIFGGLGQDVLIGAGGDDKIFGGAQHDVIRGGAGADVIFGGTQRDVIIGGTGDDVIYGDKGGLPTAPGFDDRMFGGEGDDKLIGDGGADRMTGGLGADTFMFLLGQGTDRITDFDATEDQLEIDTHTAAGHLRAEVQGDGTLVSYVVSYDGEPYAIDLALLEGVQLTLKEIEITLY